MESNTTTESPTEATSTDSVTPQVETTTTDTSVTPDETSETTTTTEQPSIETLQAQVRRIESALKKANTEAKNYRLKATELEKFKADVEAKNLSEQEKQELARKALEQQLADTKKAYDDTVREKQEIRVKHTVQLQAAKLGVEPDVAERLIDWAAIEHDDDGNPTNIQTLLNDLIKSKPYLVKSNGRQAPTTSGGATNPPRSSTANSEPLTWDLIGKLTSAQYDARRSEIQAWMSDPKNQRRRR